MVAEDLSHYDIPPSSSSGQLSEGDLRHESASRFWRPGRKERQFIVTA